MQRLQKKGGRGGPLKRQEPEGSIAPASDRSSEWVDLLALNESFFQHFLVAEPQIGDIG